MGRAHGLKSHGGYSEIRSCFPPTLRRRSATLGANQAFLLKSLERGINASKHYFAPAVVFNLPGDGHSVRVLTSPQDSEENQKLKLAQIISNPHYFHIKEIIDIRQAHPKARVRGSLRRDDLAMTGFRRHDAMREGQLMAVRVFLLDDRNRSRHVHRPPLQLR